jgi:glutamate/tyrosine decarboxylase-like PLP-dependent enzyme
VAALAHQVLDLLVGHLAQAADKPLQPDPGSLVLMRFPEQPQPADVLLPLIQQVLDGATNPAHPGYIGHMDTMPSTAALLGELVSAATNNNMLALELSPFASRLEDRLVRMMAAEFNMGAQAGGVMTAGGTLANLQALTMARNVRYPQVMRDGMIGLAVRPVILASAEAHTSLHKAAMILGLGSDAVVAVASGADGVMTAAALTAAIATQRAQGCDPFVVVATAGSTVLGAIDELDAIGQVCQHEGIWYHVDAAYAGALIWSPRHAPLLRGTHRADSLTFNPQKWMYVSKTAAMVLFRQRHLLHSHFRIAAPYMGADPELGNLGEISVQGTRHADVVKVWLTMQVLGRSGVAHLIDQSMQYAAEWGARLEHAGYVLAAPVATNLVCFRPRGASDDTVLEMQQRLQRHGVAFVSTPTWRGQRWLRSVVLNPFVDAPTLQQVITTLDSTR